LKLNIAVVGAMGAVGQTMLSILAHSALPINRLKLLDIGENVGRKVPWRETELTVEAPRKGQFADIDIALFSAGREASQALAPLASGEGAVVIDNSSYWRLHKAVPLVVPEVNPLALRGHQGIIANPNCSTIQLVVALNSLHHHYTIERVVISTYQAVSGSGQKAVEELKAQSWAFLRGEKGVKAVYQHQIAFNAIAQIDDFLENGYTKEEMKLVEETQKIMDSSLAITATAVRIPVFTSHSESVNVTFSKAFEMEEVRETLANAQGVTLVEEGYPLPLEVAGTDKVFVGRLRRDFSVANGLNFWIVADNLRKGAALNTVQIAEKLVELDLLR